MGVLFSFSYCTWEFGRNGEGSMANLRFAASALRDAVRTSVLVSALGASLVAAPGMASASSGSLKAGAAAVTVSSAQGASLAGYIQRWLIWGKRSPVAFWFKPSTGQHDPIRSKALVLETEGRKITLVSVDLVGVFPRIRDEVLKQISDLGINDDDLFIVATHTHSGPGGFVEFRFWELLAVDRFQPEFFKNLVNGIVKSIRDAHDSRRPARMATEQIAIDGVTMNRRGSYMDKPVLTLSKVETTKGETIANLLNFPIHGTLLGPSNTELSADVPGALEHAIEKKVGGVALFMSGAAGDVAPAAKTEDFQGLDAIAESFASQVLPHYKQMRATESVPVRTWRVSKDLGKPQVHLWRCIDSATIAESPVYNAARSALPLPNSFKTPLVVRGLELGKHLFVTVPGEPIAELGTAVQRQAYSSGFRSVSVIGLADSYMGYILTPEEFDRGGYETCNSFYGRSYGQDFLAATQKLVDEMSAQ